MGLSLALTKMARAFIAAFCEDPACGKAEAARKAGYSAKRARVTASELMRNPEVKGEIDRRLERQLSEKVAGIETKSQSQELTPEVVIHDLDEVSEMCKLAGAGAWQAATLVKIAELKGKYLKMWTERVEFGVDEKLIALLEAGRKRAGLIEPPTLEGDSEARN